MEGNDERLVRTVYYPAKLQVAPSLTNALEAELLENAGHLGTR